MRLRIASINDVPIKREGTGSTSGRMGVGRTSTLR